jgi:lysophospholipase L1-like esterase
MDLAWRVACAIMRPYVRGWLMRSKLDWPATPKPADEPLTVAPGPHRHRLLLIGDGPAMGYGVVSHDLALPGHIGRQLAATTERGASVQVIADEALNVQTLEERFGEEARPHNDVVVVMVGASDATCLTPLPTWRDGLHRFLRRVNQHTSSGVQVILVGLPPVSSLPVLRGVVAKLAARHSKLLNRELAIAASGYPNVTFLPFSPPPEPNPDRYRSSATYRVWAAHIAPAVAKLLGATAPSPQLIVVDNDALRLFTVPQHVIGPMARLYEEAGVPPPWEKVWDGQRDLTHEPPETWPWPWNPRGRLPVSH